MPTYRYKAVGNGNGPSEGTIGAATRREALQQLIDSGRHPLDLHEESGGETTDARQLQLPRRVIPLTMFSRQLATLSSSGTPIVKGLTVLAEQLKDPRARQVLQAVSESVQGGSTLADALAEHPRVFPRLMTSMVRVGELGGTLDEQLLHLSEMYEKEEELKGEVQAAVAHPLLVFVLGFVSTIILIVFFIPRLEGIFEDAGQDLPLPTHMLLATSHFLTDHPLKIVAALLMLILAISYAMKKPNVRLAFDRFKLSIPWVGTLFCNVELARFTRLLGTLTRAGVSIVEALNIVQPVLTNRAIAATVREMIVRISTGERLATLMKESKIFPPLSVQMVATGEETGHLDQMLLLLAEAYDRETTASTKVVTSLLAPLLILCVAGVVGFILIAMLLPIFQLSTVMR